MNNAAHQHVLDALPAQALPMVCPNCGQPGGEKLYAAGGIPAHSCLLMDTAQQALDYPCGTLSLVHCDACGFVFNGQFDESLRDYSPNYEETQHFSSHFDAFARGLAERLVDDYDIRRKRVLEIGCGKGEFLALLCELGDNRGIGIDPSARPERLDEASAARIEFLREYYSKQHAALECDVICCRHTLEHIPDTRRFLSTVRDSIGSRHDTLVFFEVPDLTRVLRECAFWDVYHEHCSYFTAGSLARLFRGCGFEITDLWRDYNDQYLMLSARPTTMPTAACLEIEDDLEQTRGDVEYFRTRCPAIVDEWRQTLRKLHDSGRRTVVWGAGSKCVAFFTTLGITREVEYVVDINPFKQGKWLPGTGHQVVGPEFLKEYDPTAVVVMNPIYCREIGKMLRDMQLAPELIPV